MASLVTVCLLLLLPPGLVLAQSTLRSQQGVNAPDPQGAPVLAPPGERHHFLKNQQDVPEAGETTYESLNKEHNRVGLFVAAAAGTMSLMAVMYCIYNRFYSKQQYMHAQLHDDAEMTLDLPGNPPVTYSHSPAGDGRERPGGYGSLSATPSVISIPPCLTPPPHRVSPFPPPYRSSQALRTISARDLERNFL